MLWSIISKEMIIYVHDRITKKWIIKEDFFVADFLFLCLDESSLFPRDKNQLSSLIIDITKYEVKKAAKDMNILLFTSIFAQCTNLEYLNFGSSISWYIHLSFLNSPPTCISSNLLELHIRLGNFIDCLYMLDGRFSYLHTFHVDIGTIHPLHGYMQDNQVDLYFLQNFKFSLLYYFSRKNCLI